MSHRYSLRPNIKGRRGHQSANEPEDQVEGTSTDGMLASKGGHDVLTDEVGNELGTVVSRPTTQSATAAHNIPARTQDSEEDWLRKIRYRVQGPAETSEEIQAARKRVEARRIAEASRIQRVQIVHGYEEDLRALQARIEALRRECEDQVEKVRKKWERNWAIEWSEMAVVVEGEEEMGEEEDKTMISYREDADGNMAVDEDYAPTETSLPTDDNEDCQWQWPSRSLSLRLQQPPHMRIFPSSDEEVGSSTRRPEPNDTEEEVERGPEISSSSRLHPSPLRRQPAQLMVVPTI